MINITLNLWYFFAMYSAMLVGIFVFPRPFKWVAYGVILAWTIFALIWATVGGSMTIVTFDAVIGTTHLNGLMSLFNAQ